MEDVFLLIKWSEFGDLPGGPVVKSVPAKAGTQVPPLVQELRSHAPRNSYQLSVFLSS